MQATKKDVSDIKEAWLDTMNDLNVCSQKGLVEMFDSSIGAATCSTCLMAVRHQLTPIQTMVAKLPVLDGQM